LTEFIEFTKTITAKRHCNGVSKQRLNAYIAYSLQYHTTVQF